MSAEQAAALAEHMQRAIRHRGPNGWRSLHDSDLLLVHRRLSIIDVSEAGAQPLGNEDGSVQVIVNGEIYNFVELRRQLASRKHRFRSRSDSEVLVHLYEEGGIAACCEAIQGMFAFALWDARSRDLYLVRDRLGIKPLVIAEHEGGVTFGSTVSAVLADRDVPAEVRREAIASVVQWGFVPSPWSVLRAARHVKAGTWLRIRAGRVVEERRWWIDLPPADEASPLELRDAVEAAVESHLIADVPVGALLSAGIDSGVVTALAARHSDRRIEAWTVSHRGHAVDELAGAEAAARHFGISLNEISVGAAGLSTEIFDAAVGAMDEPLPDASLVGLHALYAAIAPRRRVVLSGDGGDELFAGYGWHQGMPQVPTWAQHEWFTVMAPMLSLLASARGRLRSVGLVARHIRRHPASIYLDKFRLATERRLGSLGITPSDDEPIVISAIEAWDRYEGRATVERMLAVDRATMLVDQMLAKIDSASMAYGVEARVPLLADTVVERAKAVPSAYKRQGATGKVILRTWYAELGPPELAARAKSGFGSPVAEWMEGPTGRELRERARDGSAPFRAEPGDSPQLEFALAVIATWMQQLSSSRRGSASRNELTAANPARLNHQLSS